MWMFRIRKERKAYYDAAELVARVAKIESKLERMGGTGGGIYEKYESLASKFSSNMKEKIIALGVVRNSVVHGDPEIKEKEKVSGLCDEIDVAIIERMKQDGVSTMEGMGRVVIFFGFVVLAAIAYLVWESTIK